MENPDTMNVYEHHFDEAKHREAHENMLEQMAQGEREYTKQRKSSRKLMPTVIETTNIELVDEELQELLEGLE